ncbi:uncharacterized mitochondrial protein AtMg00810-like [Carya illinoinensis]|uniref:uncharacterized mitochondrial protein AtMg00810-like n=1 Tax=Carya illinoinensis TaxID=32201 RepID=UPI001C725D46|nr:uncharacterized mitochondrial protein AtMg00810-like [Carya illinoinensis]
MTSSLHATIPHFLTTLLVNSIMSLSLRTWALSAIFLVLKLSQLLMVSSSVSSNMHETFFSELNYLTISCRRTSIFDHHLPDIAHAINSVSQFLHAPIEDHFLVVKHILCYVKGTIHFGLKFCLFYSPSALIAYFDADWAGCPDTRCSTSGYSIYLGDNLVSWSAKK